MKKLTSKQLTKKNGFVKLNGHENYFIHKSGEIYSLKTNRFLKQSDSSYYKVVNIQGITYYVHRLVAQSFHKNKGSNYVVDHIDHDTHNNDYKNLRYIKKSTNVKRDRVQKKERANPNMLSFLIENLFFLSSKKLANLTGYSQRHVFTLRKKKKNGLI